MSEKEILSSDIEALVTGLFSLLATAQMIMPRDDQAAQLKAYQNLVNGATEYTVAFLKNRGITVIKGVSQ